MELTDDQIREIAESCGFWGDGIWWSVYIQRLREFVKRYEELDHKLNRQIPVLSLTEDYTVE